MKFKRRFIKKLVVLLSSLLLVTLPSCAKKGEGVSSVASSKLYIYNWTYYTPASVIEKFENETGIQVVYDEFASNEDMYAKLISGSSGYDIVFPSGDYTSIMIEQRMLEKIDKARLANIGNIDPLVLQRALYDPTMDYAVPYYWGAAGIAVNTERVGSYEKSWSIFSRADLKERMTMLDDMREVMGDALVHLGYSVNSTNPLEIEAARNLINGKWKPNLTKFDAEAFGKGFAQGDFWVVQGYAEVVYAEIADDPAMLAKTEFFVPVEGGPAYIDNMCILRKAKNKDAAYKFIDFIHRPEIYAEFCDTFGFPSTVNIPARALKKGAEHYTLQDVLRTELKDDLGETLELYNEAWFDSIRVGL